MSAFLIPLAHMDALIAYAAMSADGDRHLRPIRLTVPGDCELSTDGAPVVIDFADAETRNDVGRILYAANAEGLAAVYPNESTDAGQQAGVARALSESYTFKPATAGTDPARVIGLADCTEYQCDSAESYPMSLAEWIIAKIRAKAAGELRDGWTFEDAARDSELETLAPAPAATGDQPEPDARAAILARMNAALCGGAPALPDPAEPEPETAGPKPEPETAAKAAAKGKGHRRGSAAKLERAGRMAEARKPGKATKGRKAPAAKAGKNTAGGKRATPPANNAAAPRAKGKAPQTA